MRLSLPLVAVIALAACSEAPDEPAPRPEPPAQPPVLAGVDLRQPVRALGTEPFWAVEITPDALVYSGVDRPEQRAPNPGPVMQGAIATFTTETAEGHELIVTLMATECSDGMSDRTYPLVARVEVGEETLSGCAAPTAALMQAPEAGPVVPPQG
jgi:uncharacterized membrane protein